MGKRASKNASLVSEDRRLADERLRDHKIIAADFISSDFIAWDTEQSSGAVAEEKYGVERARVVFGLSAKAIRELGEHPCASRARLVGVEDVRPGMPKQLVFVRMFLSE